MKDTYGWTRAQKLCLITWLAFDALMLCGVAVAVYHLGYVEGQRAEVETSNGKAVCE